MPTLLFPRQDPKPSDLPCLQCLKVCQTWYVTLAGVCYFSCPWCGATWELPE